MLISGINMKSYQKLWSPELTSLCSVFFWGVIINSRFLRHAWTPPCRAVLSYGRECAGSPTCSSETWVQLIADCAPEMLSISPVRVQAEMEWGNRKTQGPWSGDGVSVQTTKMSITSGPGFSIGRLSIGTNKWLMISTREIGIGMYENRKSNKC